MAEVWAIATAAVVAAGATAYGAKSASDSADAANATNKQSVADTNALNYRMFLESRGSQGNALLPLYLPQGSEAIAANRAYQLYQANQEALGTPTEQVARYNSVVQGLEPSMQAGDKLVQDLFSGALENQQVQNIQPVVQARGAVAGAQKQGILEGLMSRLNAISADRTRAGYTGGGSAYQSALLKSATIPALQGAATVGAQADLANATDTANIRNAAIQTRLGNLSLPLTQAANRAQLINLPASATGAANAASLSPLDWFKLQPGAFRNDQGPLVSPVPNTGQIVGGAIGAGASSLANYYANRDIAQRLTPTKTFTTDDYLQQQRMANEYYGTGSGGNLFDAPSSYGSGFEGFA